jgi:hypothetical protein
MRTGLNSMSAARTLKSQATSSSAETATTSAWTSSLSARRSAASLSLDSDAGVLEREWDNRTARHRGLVGGPDGVDQIFVDADELHGRVLPGRLHGETLALGKESRVDADAKRVRPRLGAQPLLNAGSLWEPIFHQLPVRRVQLLRGLQEIASVGPQQRLAERHHRTAETEKCQSMRDFVSLESARTCPRSR